MQQAIKRAIEGRYKNCGENRVGTSDFEELVHEADLLLDPNFWQCLGKAEGWEEIEMQDPHREFNGKSTWLNNQHRLIDHLANKGSIDEFFKKLLK